MKIWYAFGIQILSNGLEVVIAPEIIVLET